MSNEALTDDEIQDFFHDLYKTGVIECRPLAYEEIDIYRAIEAKVKARALASLPEGAETAWQPIETAPRDGTYILLGRKRDSWIGKWLPVYVSGYRPDNPWASMMLNHDHMAERYVVPTHWMPLPNPPGAAIDEATKP